MCDTWLKTGYWLRRWSIRVTPQAHPSPKLIPDNTRRQAGGMGGNYHIPPDHRVVCCGICLQRRVHSRDSLDCLWGHRSIRSLASAAGVLSVRSDHDRDMASAFPARLGARPVCGTDCPDAGLRWIGIPGRINDCVGRPSIYSGRISVWAGTLDPLPPEAPDEPREPGRSFTPGM